MSDKYGSRRIYSRLCTSHQLTAKFKMAAKERHPQSLFIYYNQNPLRYNQTIFNVIANSTARKKRKKMEIRSVECESRLSLQPQLGVSMHPQYSPGWSRWVELRWLIRWLKFKCYWEKVEIRTTIILDNRREAHWSSRVSLKLKKKSLLKHVLLNDNPRLQRDLTYD